MPLPSPFHDRTLPLCESLSYRDWAGYYAPSSYEPLHEHEYNAIRNGAGLIDVSPLFKYEITGPDAAALVNRIITRDAAALAPGQIIYTPWCDEHGRVLDDGLVMRVAEGHFFWTAADPNLRWFRQNADGLDVRIDDLSERIAALSLQGPTSRATLRDCVDADVDSLKYFHLTRGRLAGRDVTITRTGYTGDLGYEIWMNRADAGDVWDAVVAAGRPHGVRAAGLLALDVARIEAGLLLIDVDFFSSRKALTTSQYYTPLEMGMDRLVDLHKPGFVGRSALAAQKRAGVPRRIAGLSIEWTDVEALYTAVGLPPLAVATASRVPVPVFAGNHQVGRMTSSTWSPILKQMIGLATIDATFAGVGSVLEVEHTVDVVRHQVRARVVELPFLRLKRKTETVNLQIDKSTD